MPLVASEVVLNLYSSKSPSRVSDPNSIFMLLDPAKNLNMDPDPAFFITLKLLDPDPYIEDGSGFRRPLHRNPIRIWI